MSSVEFYQCINDALERDPVYPALHLPPGANLKSDTSVHVCGVGDHVISDISLLADPCPPPGKEKSSRRRCGTFDCCSS